MFFVLERLDTQEKESIEARIRDAIDKSLGGAVSDVRIDWDHIREDESKIEIVISISQHVDPKAWRGGFAGLTSRIKDAMGEKLESVFPVLMARAA